MTKIEKPAIDTMEQAERAAWEQPELRRLDAAEAEAGGGGAPDGIGLS